MGKKNKKVSLAKKPFLVLSRKAIAGWLVVVFIVCAWMFFIGLLVGRGTSPLKVDINELQRQLDAAVAKLKKEKLEHARLKSEGTKDKKDLEFYETLPRDSEEADISDVPSPPAAEKKIEPQPDKAPSRPKKFSMKRRTKSPKKAAQKADVPIAAPAPEPSSPSKAAEIKADKGDKPYTIQVAAFKKAADADELVEGLKQKGFPAYRKLDKIPGQGIWFQVQVGEFKNRSEAGSTLTKLKKDGQKDAFLRKK
jgi:cell division septation protein DedD